MKELDELLKGEVNARIARDAYREACVLSELRNKFLYEPRSGSSPAPRSHKPHRSTAPSVAEERSVRREAKVLAAEALTPKSRPPAPWQRDATSWWSDLSRRRMVPAGLGLVLAAVLGLQLMGVIDLANHGLDRFSGRELARVSPHLARGHRNGDGTGPAFVGTLREDWLTLGERAREEAAEELVSGLRREGISQVMVYDDDGRLRIQALGQNLRVL